MIFVFKLDIDHIVINSVDNGINCDSIYVHIQQLMLSNILHFIIKITVVKIANNEKLFIFECNSNFKYTQVFIH